MTNIEEILVIPDEIFKYLECSILHDKYPVRCPDLRIRYLCKECNSKREDEMPLVKGEAAKTKKGFSENIKREMASGKGQKQSIAIAYSEAGEHKKKNKK